MRDLSWRWSVRDSFSERRRARLRGLEAIARRENSLPPKVSTRPREESNRFLLVVSASAASAFQRPNTMQENGHQSQLGRLSIELALTSRCSFAFLYDSAFRRYNTSPIFPFLFFFFFSPLTTRPFDHPSFFVNCYERKKLEELSRGYYWPWLC